MNSLNYMKTWVTRHCPKRIGVYDITWDIFEFKRRGVTLWAKVSRKGTVLGTFNIDSDAFNAHGRIRLSPATQSILRLYVDSFDDEAESRGLAVSR